MINKLKEQELISSLWIQFIVASYNELEQLHMQVLLNGRLAAF